MVFDFINKTVSSHDFLQRLQPNMTHQNCVRNKIFRLTGFINLGLQLKTRGCSPRLKHHLNCLKSDFTGVET